MSIDLSIVIVSYNTRNLLLDCLRSIVEHTGSLRCEIIIVDNHSQDGTVAAVRAQYPDVRLIVNPDNRGFSRAVNQAWAVGSGRHLLLLNSDTRILSGAFDKMVSYLDGHAEAGAVSCKQRTGDGILYQSCFEFPSICDHLRHARLFHHMAPTAQAAVAAAHAIDCTQSQDVDWINGACLMVRRHVLERCGGLDEGYFMYFEDVDLCQAIHRQGYRVHHLAEADIVHLVGGSSQRDRARLNVEWEFSRIRYVEKHFPWPKRLVMKLWIGIGACVRMIRGAAVQRESIRPVLSVVHRLWNSRRRPEAEWALSRAARG